MPEPNGEATHEAWSLINAFAATTSRVRLGQMCTCMAYRNPAYLAKVATTADVICGGRVEMGIGAGWYEHEWLAYGYGFPRAGERIAMLDEGVQIFKQMWTNGTATLDGEHYQVDGAQLSPLPLQVDGPPLWIAGGGEKKTLRIAAEHAEYTNFDGRPRGLRAQVRDPARALRGRRPAFEEITRSANYNVVIGDAPQAEVDDRIAWVEEHLSNTVPAKAAEVAEDFRNGPLVGTPEQIVEKLQAPGEARHDLRDHVLRRGRLRPLGHRAVRERGRPRAALTRQSRSAIDHGGGDARVVGDGQVEPVHAERGRRGGDRADHLDHRLRARRSGARSRPASSSPPGAPSALAIASLAANRAASEVSGISRSSGVNSRSRSAGTRCRVSTNRATSTTSIPTPMITRRSRGRSLDRDGLREVARLVHVEPLGGGQLAREDLQRHHGRAAGRAGSGDCGT